jgi:predicted N-formylglutamate amidohydrolase
VENAVVKALRNGRSVLHLSVHSFTPRLRGVRRRTDIGLLYDPRRGPEAGFCALWKARLADAAPRLRIRNNQPYRGTGEALTTSLREKFPASRYLGIEIEINQRFPRGDKRRWCELRRLLVKSFELARAAPGVR